MDTQTIVIVVITAVTFGLLWWVKRPDISGARAREMVTSGARLIDVRSPAEFAGSHVSGARNIPVGAIARRAAELGDKDRPIIVYCASGARSAMAKRTLKSAGFKRVYNLGAMQNW
jgi:phage shock protein E